MVMRFGRSGSVVCLAFAALLLPLSASAQPVLSVNPMSLGGQAYQGENVSSQSLQVRNAGRRALKWTVAVPAGAWFSASPANGTNGGTVTLRFATGGLPAGVHQSSFRVDSNAGSVTISVSVTIIAGQSPAPPKLVVSCPANMSVTSSNGSPVAVTYSATASGGVAPVTVNGTPASGSSFPVGTTPVSVVAGSNDGQTASCGFSVAVVYTPPPPPPPPPTTAVGPQSTITCPAGSVDIWPGSSIQNTVNLYPGATTFCIRAGTHSLRSSITPKTGNTFVGEYGAVLDGTGWSTSDGTQGAFRAHNEDIDNVTVRNLVIRNMPQRGIHTYHWMADHWTIEYNEIASNGNVGVHFVPYSLIRNNYIHHNPYSGYLGPYAHYSTIENNEIAYNGREQKVGETVNVTFRNNFVHHNAGDAIWYDGSNTGGLIEGNRIEDNGGSGIHYEISSDAIMRNNIIRRSGEVGVFLATSKNVQIYNNTLEHNFRGILYFVSCSAVGGGSMGWDLTNNTAHDNTITVGTQSGAWANGFSYTNDCSFSQLGAYLNGAKNLTFSRNTYIVPSASGWYWLWNGVKQWFQWQALGHDVTGVVSQ